MLVHLYKGTYFSQNGQYELQINVKFPTPKLWGWYFQGKQLL